MKKPKIIRAAKMPPITRGNCSELFGGGTLFKSGVGVDTKAVGVGDGAIVGVKVGRAVGKTGIFTVSIRRAVKYN